MPLTIAHPVVVLPLRRSGLPLSALIVGSIAPDLEYLLHLSPKRTISHTFLGLFVFCIPAGLIALLLLHKVWKAPAYALFYNSPKSENTDQTSFTFWPAKRFAMVCLAILVGATTHLAWDSFTHSNGWMVQRFPILSIPIIETHWGALRLFKLLQHGSTVLGLTILTALALYWRSSFWPSSIRAWGALLGIGCISTTGSLIIGFQEVGCPTNFQMACVFIGLCVVGFFDIIIGAMTIFSLLWHARRIDGAV